MRRTTMLWENWVMRFEDALTRYRSRRLTASEAGELLGMSERHFRRVCVRYEEEGVSGVGDRRLGKPSARRVPAEQRAWVCGEYKQRYEGFNVKHFHEHLERQHDYKLSYTFTRLVLQQAGVIKKAARRGGRRRRRERRALCGQLLFQDGSTHGWIPGLGRPLDLIVTADDASGAILSAFFVEQEGTMSSLRGLHEVIACHGLFCALYTDRGGHYFHTPKAGGKVDRTRLTEVGRALKQLGITHIPSYTPQGRGRIERLFGTLQGRLPNELRLHGITTIADAARYLAEVYLPDHNARFAVPPVEPDSAFLPYRGPDLDEVLCIQQERRVGNDNTVRYKRLILAIPPQRHRRHYVKATVRVHEHPDGTLAIFDGPRCLARYDASGKPLCHAESLAA